MSNNGSRRRLVASAATALATILELTLRGTGAQDRILRRLNRKERKERRDSGEKERGLALAAGRVLRPGKLAHLELIGAEVDEQTVFETGGLQVTQNLSHMLVGQSFGSF